MTDYDEPWRPSAADDSTIYNSLNGLIVAPGARNLTPERRDRIIACVNFLAGVPTEKFKGLYFKEDFCSP